MDYLSVAELIGFLAAVCTTAAFIPQAWLVYKIKDTRSISLPMYIVFNIGVICWAIYGFMISSYPITIANCLTLIFSMYILVMKVKEG